MMRRSILFGGVLSLVLIPTAFAGTYGSQQTGDMAGKKGMHGQWFQKMDKDGDGKISKKEFQEATEKKFDRLDTDKDGYISKEEWKAAAKKWKEKHKKGYRHGGSQSGGGSDVEGMEGHKEGHNMKGM